MAAGNWAERRKKAKRLAAESCRRVNIFKSHFGKRGQTCFPKMRMASFEGLQLTYLPIYQTTIPETLVEVPAEAVEAVEEAEVEEVADAEVGKRAEGGRGSGM